MSELTESEAIEMMEDNFVGQRHESENGTVYEVTGTRVERGRPELQRTPVDQNGQLVRMNAEYIALAEYRDKALTEDGEWTVVQA